MGTEEFWVPAAVAALGAGVTDYQQTKTAQQRDEQAAQGIRMQSADQQQANAKVGQQVQKLSQSTPEAQRAQAMDAFVSQLRANKANAIGQGAPMGNTSGRYQADTTAAGANVQNYGKTLATNEAGIMAPQLQHQQEGQNAQQLATDLNQIGRQSSIDQFLNQLRIRGITPNPWVSATGDVIGGVGKGLGGYYGTKKAPSSFAGGSAMTGDSPDTSNVYTGNLA